MEDVKSKAIQAIYDEHRSIAAVLAGLRELAREAADPGVRPEFPVLAAMIRYIDAFPERSHHPKEEDFIFQPLARLAPQAAGALVAKLRDQHQEGARLIRELERALLQLEVDGAGGGARFQQAVQRYADFHWDHMGIEERELLPLAEKHFKVADWQRLADAFAGNQDPIADTRDDYRKLFARIVNLAPAPVGLGEPWKRVQPQT